MIPLLFGKQEVGIWWVQKRFPRYGVPIWSLWPNIRSLPSIVAEKNVMKNVHICSMCIKINKVGKQEVGIWRVQKHYPQYGIPIWSLWPKIRFLPSTVTEKNATKNILDGQKDRGKTIYPSPPSGSGGIIKWYLSLLLFLTIKQVLKPMVFSHPVQYLGLFSLCQDRQPLTSQCPEWTCTCINCLCYTSTY